LDHDSEGEIVNSGQGEEKPTIFSGACHYVNRNENVVLRLKTMKIIFQIFFDTFPNDGASLLEAVEAIPYDGSGMNNNS